MNKRSLRLLDEIVVSCVGVLTDGKGLAGGGLYAALTEDRLPCTLPFDHNHENEAVWACQENG